VGIEAVTTGGLVERDAELRQLRRVIAGAARGDGSVTLIAAEAGLGKSQLLEAAAGEAVEAGLLPLTGRASELERDFAFGIARQALEPAVLPASVDDRERLLGGAARHAAAALDLDPDAGADRDPHSTVHGLYWLLANLAADAPLLVAIDDLQWADEPSAHWLAYAARRLEGLPIALIATIRLDAASSPASDAHRAAVETIESHPQTLRLMPPPLTDAGVGVLLDRELGVASDPEFARACRSHTGGNPFLLSELIGEITATGIAPTARSAAELPRMVPERVGETTKRHIARLSPDAKAIATALAVLGEGGDLPLAARLAGLEVDAAAIAAGELVEARVLADTSPPRFRHPLLQAAVYAGAPAPERAGRHAEAARLFVERAAPPARIAAHLLAATPGTGEPWVVEQLRAAARSARSQGVPEQAAALLRRALAEPPPPDERAAVLRELGVAELVASGSGAAESLEAALALAERPADRAEIGLALGFAHYLAHRHGDSVDVLLEVAEEVADDADLRDEWLLLEAQLAISGRYDLNTEGRVRGRIEDVAAGLTGATPGERLVISIAAGQDPGETAADLFRTARLEEKAIGVVPWLTPAEGIGTVAMYLHAGRPDAAEKLADEMLARARGSGSVLRYGMVLAAHAMVALDRGDLRVAEAELDEALTILAEAGAVGLAGGTVGLMVLALARRGLLDRVDSMLADHALDAEVPERMVFNPFLFCRGDARLAQGRFEEAEADFRELGRRLEQWRMGRPTPPWRSGCALALLAQGDDDGARALAAEELELVKRWDTPKTIAYATRALALADEDDDARIAGLEGALALLADTPWRFERAQVRLDLGSALRRSGRRRDGREALALAMDEAHACGADALAERAADELRASGARPRRRAVTGLDALTPSERRVAGLAAEGRTNRKIAQELFVTMATVETHLTRVYRKLDLDGRDGLAAALAA
jgi:DNA-binding CsgD family transcriptional regulator